MAEIFKRFVRDMMEIQDEALIIALAILILVCVILVIYWFYNRRKFQELRHEIPAHVVKNYLDTIIQNSNSLKSSLFRGGGLEVTEGIPSVMPTSDLTGGNVQVGGASAEELNQKNAIIAKLNDDLAAKAGIISDLERRMADAAAAGGGGEEAAIFQEEIAKLRASVEEKDKIIEELKANAGSGGGDADAALQTKVGELEAENAKLKEQLQEYSIIEDELANVKKLQQENEQLKKTIEELKAGGAAPAAEAPAPEPEAAPEPEPEPEPEAEEAPAEEPAAETIPETVPDSEVDLEAEMAAAIGGAEPAAEAAPAEAAPAEEPAGDDEPDVPAMDEGDKKSAEELLSEFEKMLG